MPRIRITSGDVEMTAELNDTPTAEKLLAALPFESPARLWGNEVYFDTPVEDVERDAQAVVPSGTIAFWPPGGCFCIFFGQTPASPVNVLGTLDGDPQDFVQVQSGEPVRVEAAE